jgi:glutathione S-transferase/RNA polymerase-associated protein
MDGRPADGSPLSAWFNRVIERPAVAQTLREALAFDRGSSNVAEMVAQGLFEREYRDHCLEWMISPAGWRSC